MELLKDCNPPPLIRYSFQLLQDTAVLGTNERCNYKVLQCGSGKRDLYKETITNKDKNNTRIIHDEIVKVMTRNVPEMNETKEKNTNI